MKDWRRVDPETGMWIEDVVLAETPALENGEPDPAYIAEPVPPNAGFYHPRWDFAAGVWVEGLTAEEIAERQAVTPPERTPEERRMDQIEAALIELAGMITGGV